MPGKKKKPTKKELAEAEELRKQQEEESRQKEIQAKKEREIYEQQQREQLNVLFQEQSNHLKQELDQVDSLIRDLSQKWTAMEKTHRNQVEWERFIQCNPLPDPTSESQLNTYLTLWTEDFQVHHAHTSQLIEKLDEVEEISAQVRAEIAAAVDAGLFKEYEILKQLLCRLREQVNKNWDELTLDIFQHMDEYPHEDNENFKCIAQANGHKFGVWANSTKNPRFKSIDFTDLNMSSSIPKPLSLANVGVRMLLQTSPSVVQLFKDHTDYAPVGAVLFFDLFELPPSLSSSNGWKIQQHVDTVKRLDYPFSQSTMEVVDEDPDSATSMMQWPASVHFNIPTSIMIQKEALNIMWWNEKTREWSAESIEDPDLSLSTGAVRFRTSRFAPTAVVQHSFAEYPLQSWSLQCTTQTEATLILAGKFTEIEIKIGEHGCQIMRPLEQLDEDMFKDKWMSPHLLFENMAFAGLNFIGPDERAKTVKAKTFAITNQIAVGAALFAPLLNFRKSPWNSILDSTKTTVQFIEKDVSTESSAPWSNLIVDEKFETLSANFTISYLLKDINALEDIRFDTKNSAASTAYHALRNLDVAAKQQAVLEQSSSFVQTIYNVMKIVKPSSL